MEIKNSSTKNSQEPKVSNHSVQSLRDSPARHSKCSTNNSNIESAAHVDCDQGKKMGKRKRDKGNTHCVKKRRGSLCLQKLNKVNRVVRSKSATTSPNNKSVQSSLTLDVNVPLNADSTHSCPEGIGTEVDQVTVLLRDKMELRIKNSSLQKKLDHNSIQLEVTLKKLSQMEESLSCCRKKLIEVLRHNAVMERKLREEKLERDNRQIGRIVQRQNSFGTHIDVWENGERFKDLDVERHKLEKEMEGLIQKKKELSHLKKKLRRQVSNSPYVSRNQQDGQFAEPKPVRSNFLQSETYWGIQAEVYSLQTAHIKKKQSEFEQTLKELKLLKQQHIKFIKMMNSEKKSSYQGKTLNNRYLCTGLIGRGGFSEVWKAYDLDCHRNVACKIHALNEKWTDIKKENFARHATREAQIQKNLSHPRIVQLYDVFEIDVNTFCTVLELCEGMDLDEYLNANCPLTEREARSIIIQLFEALKYLTKQNQPIIHYDLKPGNILYNGGLIKITDFGLSKIMQKDQFEMELTSQGAGTYWYLPPECFIRSQEPPMIGTAVDMWSGGCILYEMLYGRRPFGHNMSQEKILREGTLLQAKEVHFPATPKVSDEAKDLISKCLSRSHKDRPDPLTILDTHPYFSKLRPART